MKRDPRSRPLPAWLRDLPSVIDQDAREISEIKPGTSDTHARGPHTVALLAGYSALIKAASMQAEKLPFPGPWTMMLHTLIDSAGPGPWSDEDGPRADLLRPDWVMAMARDIDDAARDPGTIKDCQQALRHVTGFPVAKVRALAEPFTRATTASAYAVALMRRAVTEEEAARRMESLLAIFYGCDLHFWADHGGWPWKPIPIQPSTMFLAREIVAQRLGEVAPVAGRA
jgi:hypothetical protein